VDVVIVETDNMDSRVRGNDEERGDGEQRGIDEQRGTDEQRGMTTSGIRLYCSYCATV